MSKYRLHQSLGYHLSLAARLQERRLDDGLRDLGLTRTTWCILLAVSNEDLTQPSDIATFIGIDRTATSRALRSMEADGFISRHSGQGDRRTTRVELTPRGKSLIAKGTAIAVGNNGIMHSKLGDLDSRRLKALLSILIEGEDADLTNF